MMSQAQQLELAAIETDAEDWKTSCHARGGRVTRVPSGDNQGVIACAFGAGASTVYEPAPWWSRLADWYDRATDDDDIEADKWLDQLVGPPKDWLRDLFPYLLGGVVVYVVTKQLVSHD